MSQNRPYLDELIKALGIEEATNEPPKEPKPSVSRCLRCCWGNITGDTIFCPFVGCMKYNQVFANAMYGGSANALG